MGLGSKGKFYLNMWLRISTADFLEPILLIRAWGGCFLKPPAFLFFANLRPTSKFLQISCDLKKMGSNQFIGYMLDLPPTRMQSSPLRRFGECRTKPFFATGILDGGLIQIYDKRILDFKISELSCHLSCQSVASRQFFFWKLWGETPFWGTYPLCKIQPAGQITV